MANSLQEIGAVLGPVLGVGAIAGSAAGKAVEDTVIKPAEERQRNQIKDQQKAIAAEEAAVAAEEAAAEREAANKRDEARRSRGSRSSTVLSGAGGLTAQQEEETSLSRRTLLGF